MLKMLVIALVFVFAVVVLGGFFGKAEAKRPEPTPTPTDTTRPPPVSPVYP